MMIILLLKTQKNSIYSFFTEVKPFKMSQQGRNSDEANSHPS